MPMLATAVNVAILGLSAKIATNEAKTLPETKALADALAKGDEPFLQTSPAFTEPALWPEDFWLGKDEWILIYNPWRRDDCCPSRNETIPDLHTTRRDGAWKCTYSGRAHTLRLLKARFL
jgi:hypothetical protein